MNKFRSFDNLNGGLNWQNETRIQKPPGQGNYNSMLNLSANIIAVFLFSLYGNTIKKA